MDSRLRKRAGRFAIIVAATAAVGLVSSLFAPRHVRFIPGGAFFRSDLPAVTSEPTPFDPTVGSTVPDAAGRRIDGTEDSLSAYRGRVVLIDFWATWCKPCVAALPSLRELVAESPADRFTLLAISADFDRETVTRFMEDEPMPWVNWHAGLGRDSIAGAWGIRVYPTYLLVNEQGVILHRANGLTPSLVSALEAAVEGASEVFS